MRFENQTVIVTGAAHGMGRTHAQRFASEGAAVVVADLAEDAAKIAEQIGQQALDELLTAHRLWSDWLESGRVRKLAFVAEKT